MFRRSLFALSMAFGMLCLANQALRAEEAPAAPAKASGIIASVNAEASTFVLKVGEKDVTVKVTAETKYFVDGKAAAKDATLKVGAKAAVEHREAVAIKVEVTTPAPAPAPVE